MKSTSSDSIPNAIRHHANGGGDDDDDGAITDTVRFRPTKPTRTKLLLADLLAAHPCDRCKCTTKTPPTTMDGSRIKWSSSRKHGSKSASVRLMMSVFYVVLFSFTISGIWPHKSATDGSNRTEEQPMLASLDDIEQLSYFVLRHYGYTEQDLAQDMFNDDDFHKFIDNLRHGFLNRDPNFRHTSTNELSHDDEDDSDENDTHEDMSEDPPQADQPAAGSTSQSESLPNPEAHTLRQASPTQSAQTLSRQSPKINCANVEWQSDRWGTESPERRSKIEKLCQVSQSCQNSDQLVRLVTANSENRISLSKSIARLCPVMLYQLHDNTCTDVREQNIRQRLRPSMGSVWGFGLLFVTIISFCSLVGVSFMPLLTRGTYETILTMLTGLAVGSLLGSAIFHLIPQAFSLVGEESEHGYLWKSLIIFGGIYLFYWSERIMKIVAEERRRRKQLRLAQSLGNSEPTDMDEEGRQLNTAGNDKHVTFVNVKETSSNHSNGTDKSGLSKALFGGGKQAGTPEEMKPLDATSPMTEMTQTPTPTNHSQRSRDDSNESCHSSFLGSLQQPPASHPGHHHTHEHIHQRKTSNTGCGGQASGSHVHHGHVHMEGDTPIATVAWMIIFGDGLHNFIDGLSIGAAFSESILAGISISVAVICEELPHELGDFAILISSGMSLRQAMGYNFLSACTCYIGLGFGILIGDFAEGSSYVFALAGGMFLYISLVDMMGELSATLEGTAMKGGLGYTIKVLLLQNVGLLMGIGIMFLLARYSEHINFEGLAPPETYLSADKPLITPHGPSH